MATPYASITDTPQSLQTAISTPDYSFLQQGLFRSNQQYEQGLQQVKSDYSAILNQPLTNDENITRRYQYQQRIQEGLKKIAPSDLSLPQNVQQAENLYAPYWQDREMLQDQAYTSYAQGELSKLDGWHSNTDKDIRSQYSDISRQDIQQGLIDMKEAKRGTGQIGSVQKRDATPFYDIPTNLTDLYTKEKQTGVDSTVNIGGAIITDHNGIKSESNYRTYGLSKWRPEYDQQLRVQERVRTWNEKRDIASRNPQMSPREVDNQFALENVQAIRKSYQDNIDNYQKEANNINELYYKPLYAQTLAQKGKATPDQKLRLQEFQDKINANIERADFYKKEYATTGLDDPTSDRFHSTLEDIATHPVDYLVGVERNAMVNRWASGMASMSVTHKVELDPIWDAHMKYAEMDEEHRIQSKQVQATMRDADLKYMATTGHDLKGNLLPGFRPDKGGWSTDKGDSTGGKGQYTGTPTPGTGSWLGLGTTENVNVPLDSKGVEDYLTAGRDKVANLIYNPDGASAALQADGMSKSDIVMFTQWAHTAMAGNNPTDAQKESANRVKEILKNNGINVDGINGPAGMQRALIQYSNIAATKLLATGNVKNMQIAQGLTTLFNKLTEDLKTTSQGQANYNTMINSEILGHPQKYGAAVENGRVLTDNDLAQKIINLGVADKNGNYVPASEVLKAVQSGDVHPDESRGGTVTLTMNGTKYYVSPATPAISTMNVTNQVGNYRKQYKEAKDNAAVNMHIYPTGVVGQKFSYDPDIPGQYNQAVGTSLEASNPANIDYTNAYWQKPDGTKPLDDKTDIQALLKSPEDMQAYTSGPTIGQTNKGEPALIYTFKSETKPRGGGGGLKIGQMDIASLSGRTLVLPISKAANTPYIRSLLSEQYFVHGDLLYADKPIYSDPAIQAFGYRTVLTPYGRIPGVPGRDRNTTCNVELQQRVPDPANKGKTIWHTIENKPVSMEAGNGDANTPDEIYDKAAGLMSAYINHIVGTAVTQQNNIANSNPVK